LVLAGLDALKQEELHPDARFHARYPFATDWPLHPENTPPPSHVFSAAASYPLIFLAQMATFALTLDALGRSHAEDVFLGGAALSQGVVSALVASMSADDEALLANSVLFARYMFWHGLRCQVNDLKTGAGGEAVAGGLPARAREAAADTPQAPCWP
jgi:malonyl CoA-acyl carrier protein transacylase